jgi:hypothetical protein
VIILQALVLLVLGGLILAFLQQAGYAVLVRRGRRSADDVPFFGLLLFRGIALVAILGIVTAILVHILTGPVRG